MAHLIFIAKNRDLASFLLTGPAILGRSVECDVFTPDVFVSRQHCRFEKSEEGWIIIDQRSRNGIFFNGRRVYRRVLQHGDLIEIGSFSVRFDKGEIPSSLSTMTPFGEGTAIASLMDTLYTGGMRPSEYLRRTKRKPAWVRAKEEAEAAQRRQEEEEQAKLRAAAERLNFSDGCEIDVEAQLIRGAAAVEPEYVLVSRELLAKFNELLRDAEPTTARGVSASDDSVASTTVVRGGLERAADGDGIRGGAAVASGSTGAAQRMLGPRGPTGDVKNLWAEVYAEVESPNGKKDKKKLKKSAAAASPTAEKTAKGETAVVAPKKKKKSKGSRSAGAPIGERMKDWYEWAKTIDVSVGGIVTSAREHPKQWGIGGGIAAAALAFVIVAAIMIPKFRGPTHLTADQWKTIRSVTKKT